MYNFIHLNMIILDKLEINKIIDHIVTKNKTNQKYNYYDEVIYKFLNSIFKHLIFTSISETNKYIKILYKRLDDSETNGEVNQKHFFCLYYVFDNNINEMIINPQNGTEYININDHLEYLEEDNGDIEDDDNDSLIASNSYLSMCCLCGNLKCNQSDKHSNMKYNKAHPNIKRNLEPIGGSYSSDESNSSDDSTKTIKPIKTIEKRFNNMYKLFSNIHISFVKK